MLVAPHGAHWANALFMPTHGVAVEIVPPHFPCYYEDYINSTLSLRYLCARRNALAPAAAGVSLPARLKLAYIRAAARGYGALTSIASDRGGSDGRIDDRATRRQRQQRRCGPGCRLAAAMPATLRVGYESSGWRDAPLLVNKTELLEQVRAGFSHLRARCQVATAGHSMD